MGPAPLSIFVSVLKIPYLNLCGVLNFPLLGAIARASLNPWWSESSHWGRGPDWHGEHLLLQPGSPWAVSQWGESSGCPLGHTSCAAPKCSSCHDCMVSRGPSGEGMFLCEALIHSNKVFPYLAFGLFWSYLWQNAESF